MESVWNGVGFATLLTSLYVLRFRGWNRPGAVMIYFAFFVTLEVVASKFLLPPGAFGPGLGKVCFGLTIPVLVAGYMVWRHEQRHDEIDDEIGEKAAVDPRRRAPLPVGEGEPSAKQ